MTLFLIVSAVILGTITGTLTARRGDLLSLTISLAALLMLVLLARALTNVVEGPKCVLAGLNSGRADADLPVFVTGSCSFR